MSLAVLLASGVVLLGAEEPAQAAFPGENGRIAFVRDNSNTGADDEIFTMAPDGTDRKQLTENAGDDNAPAYSPDGTKIPFYWSGDIWTVNRDGTGRTNLTDTIFTGALQPSWGPKPATTG